MSSALPYSVHRLAERFCVVHNDANVVSSFSFGAPWELSEDVAKILADGRASELNFRAQQGIDDTFRLGSIFAEAA